MVKQLESGLYVIELLGGTFDKQPVCWQNMVDKLARQDDHFNALFDQQVQDHLNKFNLEFVKNPYPEPSLVKGTQEDLLAWIITYS